MGRERIIYTTIRGPVVAQGRPRASIMCGHVHMRDEKKSRDYKTLVRYYAQEAAERIEWTVPETPLCRLVLTILVKTRVPQSFPQYRKHMASTGAINPYSKPDLDNIAKGIMDSLNGIWYRDDKDITELKIRKIYAEEDCVEVSLFYEPIDPAAEDWSRSVIRSQGKKKSKKD